MTENNCLENLVFDLEHSGLLIYVNINHSGAGQVFFDVNYEVDRDLLEAFRL